MKIKIYLIAFFILVSVSNVIAQDSDGKTEDRRPAREKMELITMQGTVIEIEKETREVTLKGENGNLTTMTAGDEVERFDEIAVGDVITFDYYTYLKAEFREPTAEELENPIVVVAEAGKAPGDEAPAGAIGAVVKAVVTIEMLNRPYMLATVKGPMGNYTTLQMEDEELITKLNIGEVVILTYAEAVAISLKKVETEVKQ